jgi:hypothetical protein
VKPFHFNNCWLENRNFKGVVEESWRCFAGKGWMGFLLKEKLKYLKGRLKDWNKEEYGCVEERMI